MLAGELEEFSTPMSELRKETMAWYRYYSQLDDVACELREWYAIGKTLTPLDRAPESGAAVVLLNSDELAHETALPGLEAVLHHTPSARDAHVCKAEVRSNCLSGTLALPRGRRDGTRLCCGYLVTKDRVVLVDDGEMAEPF